MSSLKPDARTPTSALSAYSWRQNGLEITAEHLLTSELYEPLTPGTIIGDHYQIEELLGKGGMSTVYKARDTVLEHTVAIKIPHRHLMQDAVVVQRLFQEARAI